MWFLALVAAAERPLFAYIDPGSGALLWQAILAGAFGAIFYFRKFIAKLTFKRKKTDDPPRPGTE